MRALRVERGGVGDGLESEWEELAERANASPFARPGWAKAWSRAFGGGRHRVLAVRETGTGDLRGVLPVRERLGGLSSPTNWHSAEFGPLTDLEEAGELLMGSLFGLRRRRVELGFLDRCQADRAVEAAASEGYLVLRRTLLQSPYVAIDGDWEAFEERLGRRLRSELRRRERRLGERGRVELEVGSGEQLEERLEEGFRVEQAGWKGARGTAIRSRPSTRRFYTEVSRWAARRGWLRLAFLRLDGRAIAFDLGLEHGGVHYLLKTGYDAAFGELGPGKLLRHRMLARAFRSGLSSYEFLGRATPWKLEWTQAVRERELVQGFRPSILGALDWSAFAYGRPLARQARSLILHPEAR